MKEKTITILFLIFLGTAGLQAQIYHNDDIFQSEIWFNDSIHYIETDIELHYPAILTIMPGAEVRFRNGAVFSVWGSIQANGTETQKIIIRGVLNTQSGNRYGYLKIDDDFAGSSFHHVNFCYGGIMIINECQSELGVTLNHCDFFGESQEKSGLIIQNNSNPGLTECKFYDDAFGLDISSGSVPILSNCTFEGLNNALEIRTGASPALNDCSFSENNTAVMIISGGNPHFNNCTMNWNINYGVDIQGASSDPVFTNCQFDQNNQNGVRIKFDAQATFTDCQANLNGSHGLNIEYSNNTTTLNNFVANQNEGSGVYAISNLVVNYLEANENEGFGLNFNSSSDHELEVATIVSHGNDTTSIRVPARLVEHLLQPDVELDFQNNHPDGIEIFDSHITENTVWPQPPFNHDLYLGGLYIAEGASLEIIHPNTLTTIYCREEAEIQVIEGTLKAENIQFLPAVEVAPPANKGYWKGIYFSNSDSSELKNCMIKNAGFSNTGDRFAGIEIFTSAPPQDSAVIINDCNIEDCAGDGIYIYRSNPLIKNTFIAGCDSTGVYMDYYAGPFIDNCIIMQNGSYGIFCNHKNSGGLLRGCDIKDNQGPPARLPTNMVGGLFGAIITGNQPNNRIEIAGGYMEDDAIWPGNLEYYVYKQIRTEPGKLTIAPGAVLKFLPYTDLTVKSSLNAIGTSDQHIVFTSAQNNPAPQDWQGLIFHHATDTSHLSYCDIKYAGQSEWKPNIYTENSEVYLSHCDVSYSGSSGMINMGGGDGKYLYITDCYIHHNQTHGLSSEWFWYNYTHMSHTNIYENGEYAIVAPADVLRFFTENINIHSNGHDAIKVVGGWEPGAFDGQIHQGTWRNHGVPYEISQHISLVDGDTLIIEKGNTFYMEDEVSFWVDGALIARGNADSAITFTRMPGSENHWQHILFKNDEQISELEYCNFSHGGYFEESKNDTTAMISLVQAGAKFQNCTIDSSFSNGVFMNQNASAEYTNTAIRANAANGIYIGADGNNMPVFGNSLAGWNDIHGNGTYNISNNSPNSINAAYIWWGTLDGDEIAGTILENAGTVAYTPWTNADHTMLYPAGAPVQEITLPAGWSSLSSYIMPDAPALDDVFAPIADELIIAQTMTGFYYPGDNINTIGNWPQHAAIMIKTNESCTLPISGIVEQNKTIMLASGWNLVPVISETEIDVEDLFDPLGNLVIIVKEAVGYAIFWPGMGINTIGVLQPGKAYLIKVAEDIEIEFP